MVATIDIDIYNKLQKKKTFDFAAGFSLRFRYMLNRPSLEYETAVLYMCFGLDFDTLLSKLCF